MRTRLAVVLLLAAACSPGGPAPGDQAGSGGTTSSPSVVVAETDRLTCWAAPPAAGGPTIAFSDQTESWGLVAPLRGMHGHAAVWGDLSGDDRPDLFVGTFADREPDAYRLRGADGPAPDRLLLSDGSGFHLDEDLPEMFSRTSGGAVADLDGDGDLDLVVSRNFDDDMPGAPGIQVLANDGGRLAVATESGLPAGLGGRSVGVLDYDHDGDLDLLVTADEGGTVLLRNEGGLTFTDVTAAAGLPADLFGLGVAVADFNGDGHQDLFVAGANRLFIATGSGGFTAADSGVFAWQALGDEDLVSGATVADVNRDGRLDLAVGHHFNSTVDDGALVPVRLYLNRGPDGAGIPSFEDVTDASGLVGLPTKAPHVELNDMDNDGWPDLVTTASAGEGTTAAVFRHQGLDGDVPTFAAPDGLGDAQYWIAGPSADVDRDGRLDLFLVEWEPALPSLLLRNEAASGHWLEVSVAGEHGHGLGWRIEVYRAGGIGDADALLGTREITVTQGYSAGVAPVAHFGLGEEDRVDVRLVPPGEEAIELGTVGADRHIRYPEGCD